jgi:hypothetical protein
VAFGLSASFSYSKHGSGFLTVNYMSRSICDKFY